jgi:putative membrane protein
VTIADLPLVHACINACVFVLLCLGYIFIKQNKRVAHQRAMLGAVVLSTMFLASYVYYHFNAGSTKFAGEGYSRPVYFTILITHTVLATANLPFVIITVWRAWKKRFKDHARIAKPTWAVWMYVAFTGPVVYLMLYQLYPHGEAAEKSFALARTLHREQKDQEALDAYRRAETFGLKGAGCYAAVLQDRLENKQTTNATIAAVLAADPHDVHCLVLKAREMIYEDRAIDAIPILEEAVERSPEDGFFVANLGTAYFRALKYDEAAVAFERAAVLDPTLPANVFNAGYAYFLGAKYSKAKPILEKALTLKELDGEARVLAQESLDIITGALWVCPMHPDVTGKSGDKCPECGMKLEPLPHGLTEEDEQ